MSLSDVIFGPAKLLGIVITFFVCIFIWVGFVAVFNTLPTNSISLENQNLINQTASEVGTGLYTIDYVMPMIVVGMLIVSLIFAFRTGANVVYAVLAVIMWVFALMMSAIFTNTYIQIENVMNLGTTLIIADFLMMNLKWIVLGWLVLITIVIFSRNKQEDGSGGFSASEQVFR